ncbi:MAG TPA: FAD-dependent monooxygenase, partial [Burkholderiaceae bacterium]|nr:FAD-dependent monooxygenase [Burkholderiaceae bacterium]
GWVLVGDAAHVVHPLAGQGLNLGLGDVQVLAETLAGREPWRALGDERLLARYARARAWPVRTMSWLTDALVHGFSSQRGWARELRNRGMGLVERATPAKRWLAARALEG